MTQEITVNPLFVCLDIVQNSIDLQSLIDYTKNNYKKEVVWLNAQDFADQSNRSAKNDGKGGTSKPRHDNIVRGLKSKIEGDLSKALDSKKKAFASFEKAKAAAAAGKPLKGKNHLDGEPPKLELPFKGQIDVIYFILNFPYLPQQLQDSLDSGLDLSVFLAINPQGGPIYSSHQKVPHGDKTKSEQKVKKSCIYGSELDYTLNPHVYPPARWTALRQTSNPSVLFTEINATTNDIESTFHSIEETLIKVVSVKTSFSAFLSERQLKEIPVIPPIQNLDISYMNEYSSQNCCDIVNALYYQLEKTHTELKSIVPPPPDDDIKRLFSSNRSELDRQVIAFSAKEAPEPAYGLFPETVFSMTFLKPLKDWKITEESAPATIASYNFISSQQNFFAYAGQKFDQLYTLVNKKYNLQMPASFFDWSRWNYRTFYANSEAAIPLLLQKLSIIETQLDDALGMLWVLALPPVSRNQGQTLRWSNSPPTLDGESDFMANIFNHENDSQMKRSRNTLSPASILQEIAALLSKTKEDFQEHLANLVNLEQHPEPSKHSNNPVSSQSSLSAIQSNRGEEKVEKSPSKLQAIKEMRSNLSQIQNSPPQKVEHLSEDIVKARLQSQTDKQIESLLKTLLIPNNTRYSSGVQMYKMPMNVGESVDFSAPYFFESGLRVDIHRSLYRSKMSFGYTLLFKNPHNNLIDSVSDDSDPDIQAPEMYSNLDSSSFEVFNNSESIVLQLANDLKFIHNKDGTITIVFLSQSISYNGDQITLKSWGEEPMVITKSGSFITSYDQDKLIVYSNGDISRYDGKKWILTNTKGECFEKVIHHPEPEPIQPEPELIKSIPTSSSRKSSKLSHGSDKQEKSEKQEKTEKQVENNEKQSSDPSNQSSRTANGRPTTSSENPALPNETNENKYVKLDKPNAFVTDFDEKKRIMIRYDNITYYINDDKSRKILLDEALTIDQINSNNIEFTIPSYPFIYKKDSQFIINLDRFEISLSPNVTTITCDEYKIEARGDTTFIHTPTNEAYLTPSRLEVKAKENKILIADENGIERLGDLIPSSTSSEVKPIKDLQSSNTTSSQSTKGKAKSKKNDNLITHWGEASPIKETLTEQQQLELTNTFLPRFFVVSPDNILIEFRCPSTITLADITTKESEMQYSDGSQCKIVSLHHSLSPDSPRIVPKAFLVDEPISKLERANIMKGLHISKPKAKSPSKSKGSKPDNTFSNLHLDLNSGRERSIVDEAFSIKSRYLNSSRTFLSNLRERIDIIDKQYLESVNELPTYEDLPILNPPCVISPRLQKMMHDKYQQTPPASWLFDNSPVAQSLNEEKRELIKAAREQFDKDRQEIISQFKNGEISQDEKHEKHKTCKQQLIEKLNSIEEDYTIKMNKFLERHNKLTPPPIEEENQHKSTFQIHKLKKHDKGSNIGEMDIGSINYSPAEIEAIIANETPMTYQNEEDLANENSGEEVNKRKLVVLSYWASHEADFAMPIEEERKPVRPISPRVLLNDPPRTEAFDEPPIDEIPAPRVVTRSSLPIPKSAATRPRTISTEPQILNFLKVKANTPCSKPLVITNLGRKPLHFSVIQPKCPTIDGQPIIKVLAPVSMTSKVFPGLKATLKIVLLPAEPQHISTSFTLKTSEGDMTVPIIVQIE